MANVRKLMRMAREFEADEGRDLRGFIDAVAERDVIQAREGEAPLEAEALDAVRHDDRPPRQGPRVPGGVRGRPRQGRPRGRRPAAHLRRRQRGPAARRRSAAARWTARSSPRSRRRPKRAGEEEERRIFYVAATRAQEHLVLSGATDLAKRPDPAELTEPMRWIWRGFCAGLPDDGATGTSARRLRGPRRGRPLDAAAPRRRWTSCSRRPTARRCAPVTEEAPSFEQPLLELGLPPAPRALAVSRLSYSGLAGVPTLRLPLLPGAEPPAAAGWTLAGRGGAAAGAGLEPRLARHGRARAARAARLRAGRPVPGDAEVAAAIEHARAWTAHAGRRWRTCAAWSSAWPAPSFASASPRPARVRTELPFAFTLDAARVRAAAAS